MATATQINANTAKVPIKTAWLSKINWTQAVAFIAALATMFGIDLDSETQSQILTGIVAIQAVVSWVLRTWFNASVSQASLP